MKNNQEAKINHTSREAHHQHHTIYNLILHIQYAYIINRTNEKNENTTINDTLQVVHKWGMTRTVKYPLKRYTDVKLFYTRSLFGAKRAFRNNTVSRKTSFDPEDCSYRKNKSLVKNSPYEAITVFYG